MLNEKNNIEPQKIYQRFLLKLQKLKEIFFQNLTNLQREKDQEQLQKIKDKINNI